MIYFQQNSEFQVWSLPFAAWCTHECSYLQTASTLYCPPASSRSAMWRPKTDSRRTSAVRNIGLQVWLLFARTAVNVVANFKDSFLYGLYIYTKYRLKGTIAVCCRCCCCFCCWHCCFVVVCYNLTAKSEPKTYNCCTKHRLTGTVVVDSIAVALLLLLVVFRICKGSRKIKVPPLVDLPLRGG